MVNIMKSLFGGVVSLIGLGVWYIDWLVFNAIGSLGAYVASVIGATGGAAFGVMVIAWILTFGIMVSLLIAGGAVFFGGIGIARSR